MPLPHTMGRLSRRLTKNKPAMPPTGTQSAMAFGTFMAGSAHSSAMAETIPMAEKVYAEGRIPIKKEKSPTPRMTCRNSPE